MPRLHCLIALLLIPVSVATAGEAKTAGETKEENSKRLTFDAGGSSSFSGGSNAFEGHLGINYYVLPWLAWRNSPFFRAQSGMDSSFGLDSSLEGHISYAL